MKGVPVKPTQSKLKTTSIAFTDRLRSRISMRRRMISYRNFVSPAFVAGCFATSSDSESVP